MLSRARARALAAALLAVGIPVMVGLFPPQSPSPFGRLLEDFFLYVPGGIGFRTTNKVGALVALALVLLIALGVATVAGRLMTRKPWVRLGALAAALLVVALTVYPAWSGHLYQSGWRSLPSYWNLAAHDLNAGGRSTRALLLPGEGTATYRWGKRGVTDIGESLLSRPWVERVVVPTGSAYSANFLAAMDVPLNDRTYLKGTLPAMARYMGARDVLVRNDMTWEQWGGAPPAVIAAELREPGLRLVRSYGSPTLYAKTGPNSLLPQ